LCSTHLGVTDHFITEALRAVSPPDRDFLLRTSKTEMLNGDLADQMTGRTDGQSILERLFESNVFTVRRGHHGWYSYQPCSGTC
jgi:ATP/maltotriose-dependent transcriptional regulator MalT